MYQILKRFKAKTHKPVVASVQEVGASGAYYVSCAADKIVAQPTSLVGSIGVIFETFNLEGTMYKLGAKAETYKSAAHKDIGSYFREPTDDEKVIMQQLVDVLLRQVQRDRHQQPANHRYERLPDDYRWPCFQR